MAKRKTKKSTKKRSSYKGVKSNIGYVGIMSYQWVLHAGDGNKTVGVINIDGNEARYETMDPEFFSGEVLFYSGPDSSINIWSDVVVSGNGATLPTQLNGPYDPGIPPIHQVYSYKCDGIGWGEYTRSHCVLRKVGVMMKKSWMTTEK